MDHDPTARETCAVGSGPHWSQNLVCSGIAAKGLMVRVDHVAVWLQARVLQKQGYWYESQQRANWACRAAILSAVIGSIVNVSILIAVIMVTDYRT